MAQAADSVAANFGRVFQRQVLAVETLEGLLSGVPLSTLQ
jgi:hypothetical protein